MKSPFYTRYITFFTQENTYLALYQLLENDQQDLHPQSANAPGQSEDIQEVL